MHGAPRYTVSRVVNSVLKKVIAVDFDQVQMSDTDRYITFIGLQCDEKADRFIAMLDGHIEAGDGDERWQAYFKQKRTQQIKMEQDNLQFIGSQMNNLYSYMDDCEDESALALLWKLEQECC